jgi:hypothetical protein
MQIFFLQYARPMNKLGKCISTNFTFFFLAAAAAKFAAA